MIVGLTKIIAAENSVSGIKTGIDEKMSVKHLNTCRWWISRPDYGKPRHLG